MNMMQHLQVPNREVEQVLLLLKNNNWLADGKLIYPSKDDKYRLIPLSTNLPEDFPDELSKYKIINANYKFDSRINPDWLTHLSSLIDKNNYEKFEELWPTSHEFMGDMMIIKLDKQILSFSSQIANAKLISHPNLRLVLADHGVKGEFRIRQLIPIGVRHDNQIILKNIPEELCKTKVTIKESGLK